MKKTLLIIGFVWPEPNSSAAGSRMMQLITLFKSLKYTITFASACTKTKNAFDLKQLGVDQVTIKLNDSSFDDFVAALNPNIVLFDRFMIEEQYGWRVTENCPNALRILDTEDLHCLRKARQKAFQLKKPFNEKNLFSDDAKREIASIYRCDLSLIISEVEMKILTETFKIESRLLFYLPFLLHPISNTSLINLPKFDQREHFITIGNFLHPPNYQSVLYLKQTIWPLIRKEFSKAKILIYGAYASQKITQLHNENDGFIIKGFAKDVNQVMQSARLCLAPLQFGAGLKGKLIDAMQNGTPCMMSCIAAEGMFGNFDANGFIEDNPEAFAQKTIELYKNQSLWTEKQDNGFRAINSRFQISDFQKPFINTLDSILLDLSAHRQENFIGQILQHHTIQSTKFMSKWIEEKQHKK
ncbi:glycosyltransferase family 4 protein [uncultured Psychroserpens sp.]|uniref:glycosyltransferase n=1 Tax=uncultured Psychroserpens sp. TaxID=255436 RepID=UPI00262437E7|nr:glycosyltransferase family 4 protein [uncultured Psychroserpens sp.]